MNKSKLAALVSGIIFASVPVFVAASEPANFSGVWQATRSAPGNVPISIYLNLAQKDDRVGGTILMTWGTEPIHEGQARGNSLRLRFGPEAIPVRLEGNLVGGRLDLTLFDPRSDPVSLNVKRLEHLPAPPPRLPLPVVRGVSATGNAPAPPMGWNSWNRFNDQVDDVTIRAMADAMVSSGMRDAGYVYVIIDDSWAGGRDAQGNLRSNTKFPDMKALADYVHARGLKLGLYSAPGPTTCAGYEGSYGHENQDAAMLAAWGIDYFKYDWCTAGQIYKDSDMRAVYQKLGDALHRSGRNIVYSLCQYGRDNVVRWGPLVGGSLWRTTGDIQDNWKSMRANALDTERLGEFAGPNHWNDPDMLEVGNGGMTTDEYRTHMSLWALLAAPLIAGNDLRKMTPEIQSLLMNREIIAVDQDSLGMPGKRIGTQRDAEVWLRTLADGARVIAIINTGENILHMNTPWKGLGISSKPKSVRDLWERNSLTRVEVNYFADIPPHAVKVLKVIQ